MIVDAAPHSIGRRGVRIPTTTCETRNTAVSRRSLQNLRGRNLHALHIRFVVLLVRNVATRCTFLSLGRTLAPCCSGRDTYEIDVHAQTLETADNARLKPSSTPTFPRTRSDHRAGRIFIRQSKVRVIQRINT